ncbi:hypothetical protein TCAL_16292, partial [Tigriopus californicus]
MPFTCASPGCTTGFKSKPSDSSVSLHKFPDDPDLHFKVTTSDFRRKDQPIVSIELTRRYLTSEAVPSVFPNLPKYLSTTRKPTPRTNTTSTTESRRQILNANLRVAEDNFFKQQLVSTLNDVKEKVTTINLPPEVVMQANQFSLVFASIVLKNGSVPHVEYAVVVDESLSLHLSANQVTIPISNFSYLTASSKLTDITTLANIIHHLKNYSEASVPSSHWLSPIITDFKDLLDKMDKTPPGEEMLPSLCFLLEQLELALAKPKSRRYSASLLASASMWQIALPALYKQFLSKRILSLPSLTTIKRLSSNLSLN